MAEEIIPLNDAVIDVAEDIAKEDAIKKEANNEIEEPATPPKKEPSRISRFIFSTSLFLEHTIFVVPTERIKKILGKDSRRKAFFSLMYSPKTWWYLFLLFFLFDGVLYRLVHWKIFFWTFIILLIAHRLVTGEWKHWARQRGYKV